MRDKKISKQILVFLLFLLPFFSGVKTFGQECEAYYPMDPGTVMEMTSYNAKGKEQGRNVQTILEKNGSGNLISATIKSEHFDKKDKPTLTQEYEIYCKDGVFSLDMKAMMNPETFASYENMEIEVDAEELEFPATVTPGMELPDATLTVSVSSGAMNMMNISVQVTNRKVEGMEEITTPAGTFNCIKLSQDVTTKMMIKIEAHSVDWYAPNTGVVRSESYNKNGKLNGYTELTKFVAP